MAALSHNDILGMSLPDRPALIGELRDSIPDAQLPVSASHPRGTWKASGTFEDDIKDGVSWETLKAELTPPRR
jgi:hypothetical protein